MTAGRARRSLREEGVMWILFVHMVWVVACLGVFLAADAVMDRRWPWVLPVTRVRWRRMQKALVDPFLPMDWEREGPIVPLPPMVDAQRFLERPKVYLGRLGVVVAGLTALHYWDKAMGLTGLWFLSYVVGAFFVVLLSTGIYVYREHN